MASPQQNGPGPAPPHPTSSPASPDSASASPRPGFLPRSSTGASLASNATSRLRSASIKLLETDLPPGFMAATGNSAARMHTIADIRRGSLGGDTSNSPVRRDSEDIPRKFSRTGTGLSIPKMREEDEAQPIVEHGHAGAVAGTPLETLKSVTSDSSTADERNIKTRSALSDDSTKDSPATKTVTADTDTPLDQTYANGYEPPPKLPWTTSTAVALKAYGKWVLTIPGFLITLYGLNVVAWGGMLFLLLCNASPAMCVPTCNDLYSPRRVWIEIDSQILNALFCVTGFGLIPWRFRDWWWWGVWRVGFGKAAWGATREQRKRHGLRVLAGYNRTWFRLPGSERLPARWPRDVDPQRPPGKPARRELEGVVDEGLLPVPAWKVADPPPTGVRAPPTAQWKMDFAVWCFVINTFLQGCLSAFMWALNRFDRPSWSTGLFVALACGVAGMGGLCMFLEGKAVKKVEGVPMESWKGVKKMDEEEGAGLVEVGEGREVKK